jgi:hypothetical protein
VDKNALCDCKRIVGSVNCGRRREERRRGMTIPHVKYCLITSSPYSHKFHDFHLTIKTAATFLLLHHVPDKELTPECVLEVEVEVEVDVGAAVTSAFFFPIFPFPM